MQRSTKRRGRLARLCLAVSLLAFCAACSASRSGPVRCPMPNTAEIDDYALIVEVQPDRPAVRWISRLIGYCWPDEAEEVRRDGS